MAQQVERQDGQERRPDELVVDQLAEQLDRTVTLLRGGAHEAAEKALSRVGGQAEVEARIALEIADRAPLAEPERFLEAHQLTMHALEVLDRDGFRDPPVPRFLGPLGPLAAVATEFVAGYIVKSYASSVVDRLQTLYSRREVQCERGTRERTLLTGRRVEMERLAPMYKGGGRGAPALLGAGAALPLFASVTGYAGAIEWTSRPVLVAALVIGFLLVVCAGWVLLNGAAVARRRSQLIMAAPLAALWQTVGRAGAPPQDDSVFYATIAVLLTTTVWIVIPAVAGILVVAW